MKKIILGLLVAVSLCFSGVPSAYGQDETDVGTSFVSDLVATDVAPEVKVDDTVIGFAAVEAAITSYELLLSTGYEEIPAYGNINSYSYNLNANSPDVEKNVYFWWNTRLCVFSPNVNIYN
jgi:hypothetical protein